MRTQPTATLNKIMLIAAVGAAACFAPNAMAQNALGDGRGLEANPRQGSNGLNYRPPSFEKEVAFRNAIATGNAPGGLSFRGDLGYQAPGEFAGDLGSDALYSFRRDSLYSGLAGMGIRGTDALQYQFAMTTGSRITQNLSGNLSVSRLGGSSSASFSGGYNDPVDPLAVDRVSLRDKSSAVSGTLRSTSSYTSTNELTPELLSVFSKGIERERYGIVASPLMGLVATPMTTEQSLRNKADLGAPAKTSYDDVLSNIRDRAKKVLEDRKENSQGGTDTPDAKPGTTPDGTGLPGNPAEVEQANDIWISQQIEQLQRQLLGLPAKPDADAPVEVVVPENPSSIPEAKNGMTIRDPMRPRRKEDATNTQTDEVDGRMVSFDRGESGASKSMYEVDPETLELIRGNGKRVTFLVDPTAELRNIYGEHMKAGEELLAGGRYFDAEERFTHALGIRRGDVSAQLGRLHAQIGAGLVASASVNFQTLMSEHLEIVSQRYGGKLLPDEQRVRELIEKLRKRALLDERPSYVVAESSRVRVACGLMIAYLGYQLDDEQQMTDGLSVVRQLGTDADKRLVRLLETVWGAVIDGEQGGAGQNGPYQSESELKP